MTTAQVLISGPNGEEIKARALIDSGAGLSLVSRRVAQILNLPLEPAKLQLSAVQGEISKPLKHVTMLHISPLQNRQKKILCKPAVTQMVTSDLPTEPVHPVGDLPHIMGLQLADPDYYNPGRIDILLGADMAPKIMVKELLRDGTDAEPILILVGSSVGLSQESITPILLFLPIIKHKLLQNQDWIIYSLDSGRQKNSNQKNNLFL